MWNCYFGFTIIGFGMITTLLPVEHNKITNGFNFFLDFEFAGDILGDTNSV